MLEQHLQDVLAIGSGAFTRKRGRREARGQATYHLTREGGHSHRRVVHVDDATGRAISDTRAASRSAST